MRYTDLKRHLKPYSIVKSRTTTINHAFASAIAGCDQFDDSRVKEALITLGLDPEFLTCVYCGKPAESWDHLFATVQNKTFSGHGHRLGNLVPCCKPCNSSKGNKDWKTFVSGLPQTEEERLKRSTEISKYVDRFLRRDPPAPIGENYRRLETIKKEVLNLMKEADEIAARIRDGEA